MVDFLPLAAADSGDILLMLLGVLAADLLLGVVPGLARLVPAGPCLFSRISNFFVSRLDRAGRSRGNLAARGAFVLLLLMATGAVAGVAISVAVAEFTYGWVLGAVVLLHCIGGRGALHKLRIGLRLIAADDIDRGRDFAGRLAGRDASNLDRFGIGRVVIEGAAVEYALRVVTPVFWFVLLGFPGVLAAAAAAQLTRSVMRSGSRSTAFGRVPLAIDHQLGLVPSYIAGFLLAIASLVTPSGAMHRALHFMSLDAHRDAISNDGRIKAAVAGALGLALGGPFGTRGGGARDNWIGNGRARVGQTDMRKVLMLISIASLVHLALVSAVVLAAL